MLELDPTLTRVVRTHPARASIAISVGVAIGLAATGIALVHAGFTAPEPNCPPIVIPAAPAVVPPAAVAPVRAPCAAVEETTTLADWTWGQDHLGPFTSCATIDRAFVGRVLPGYDVRQDDTQFFVTRKGQPVLTIDTAPLRVVVDTPELETPWRVHAGDTFKTLRAHHRRVVCVHTGNDDDDPGIESATCAQLDDGWHDTLRYALDAPAAGKERSAVDDLDFEAMAPVKIHSIIWQPPR